MMSENYLGGIFLATPADVVIVVGVHFEMLVPRHWIVKELIAVAALKV